MIKLVIFDLDGVLVETKKLHFNALNSALKAIDKKFVISEHDHLSRFDGLSTNKKLDILCSERGLSKDLKSRIWEDKQRMTIKLLSSIKKDHSKIELLSELKNYGFIVAVASNSISKTVSATLDGLGLNEYVDFYLSNEDVKFPKPNAAIYLSAMAKAGVSPNETLIVEDSVVGRTAANASKAHLLGVLNPEEVTISNIMEKINSISPSPKAKWQCKNMNILIPMAGAGSRFEKAGFSFPKPLIDVKGKPMIQWVVENIGIDAKYIFIAQKSHYDKFNLKSTISNFCPNNEIVLVDGVTDGAARTTLLAQDLINNENSLIIANSDQLVVWDSHEFAYTSTSSSTDASIATFNSTHPKWSFVRLNSNGFVSEVAEKNPISDIATVGIYFWKRGSDYVKYANQMINKNIRVNNEFYVAPVFNEAIADGKKIRVFGAEKMYGLGTPEDLQEFLRVNDPNFS